MNKKSLILLATLQLWVISVVVASEISEKRIEYIETQIPKLIIIIMHIFMPI